MGTKSSGSNGTVNQQWVRRSWIEGSEAGGSPQSKILYKDSNGLV